MPLVGTKPAHMFSPHVPVDQIDLYEARTRSMRFRARRGWYTLRLGVSSGFRVSGATDLAKPHERGRFPSPSHKLIKFLEVKTSRGADPTKD